MMNGLSMIQGAWMKIMQLLILDKYQSRYSLCTLYYNYIVVQVPHVCLCLCFLEKYGQRVEKD